MTQRTTKKVTEEMIQKAQNDEIQEKKLDEGEILKK